MLNNAPLGLEGASPWLAAGVALVGTAAVVAGLVSSDTRRVAIVGALGLLGLGGGAGFSPLEVAWFGSVLLATLIAIPRLTRHWASLSRWWRRSLGVSLLTAVWLGASVLWAHANGATVSAWVSAAAPALSIPACVTIGASASLSIPLRSVSWMVVIAAALTSLAYGVFWATRRGLAEGASSSFLPSLALSLLGLSVAVQFAIARPRSWWWVVPFLGLCAALLLGSNNRTALVGLAGLAVGSVLASRARGALRATALLVLATGAIVVSVGVVAAALGVETEVFRQRLATLGQILDSGIESDLSGASRLEILQLHREIVAANPVLGLGPGATPAFGQLAVDSPLLGAVKFGMIGLGLLVILLSATTVAAVATRPLSPDTSGHAIWRRAVLAWSISLAFVFPLAGVFDDKGTPIALLFAASALGPFRGQAGPLPTRRRAAKGLRNRVVQVRT